MQRFLVITILLAVGFLAVGLEAWRRLGGSEGFSARSTPSKLEAWAARRLRLLAMPRGAREASNPVVSSSEVLREGRAHFADHCAICHANDGSGDTEIGRNIYPRAPDMRAPETQSSTDGELFFVIRNGIRLTGMPAWGDGTPEDDIQSWNLVHFIRHLPDLTPQEIAEMGRLDPRAPGEDSDDEADRRFLEGRPAPEERGHHQ